MIGVMRTRRGFRVILNAKNRLITKFKTGHRAVVEVVMGDINPLRVKGVGIQGKTVVLACDFNQA